MSIDILDLKIIKCLTEDARCTYKHIAVEAGVSEATVKNRIDHLREDGIIKKYTVIMDYHKLGRAIKAFIGLKIHLKYMNFTKSLRIWKKTLPRKFLI